MGAVPKLAEVSAAHPDRSLPQKQSSCPNILDPFLGAHSRLDGIVLEATLHGYLQGGGRISRRCLGKGFRDGTEG